MIRQARLTMLAALLLAGCADQGAAGPEPPLASAAKEGSCRARSMGLTIRAGEDKQILFSVPVNSRWCYSGVRLGGTNTNGQRIVEPPRHGELQLVDVPGVVAFAYRPNPGYVGGDRFRIALPAEIETIYFVGNATVTP